MIPLRSTFALLLLVASAPAAAQGVAAAANPVARVDAIFGRFAGAATPGCAVGVTQRGQNVVERAYGMADLEHDAANVPGTIFEAGSVSKQFTAAAVVMLALDGKLRLDDDVRKYIPELPEYGAPITIRHLLNHTSGLRDWGEVAALGGWPRGTRAYTNEIALDIARHQRALNYKPGELYSYTNTGFNLLAILVSRVAGVPLAEFTRTYLFEPLGMTSTSWRDDYARVVKGRAIGYQPASGGAYRMDMPFENAHGNGGLLTTVADLLRWTKNLQTGQLGGPTFIAEMQRQARLNGGRTIEYASGLFVTSYRGVPEISHSGATAGYRAFLARYPKQDLAVAVLCNAADANPVALGHQVAEMYLGDAMAALAQRGDTMAAPGQRGDTMAAPGQRGDTMAAPVLRASGTVAAEAIAARAGVYRNTRSAQAMRLSADAGRLRIGNGPPLVPLSESRFLRGASDTVAFEPATAPGGRAAFRLITAEGDAVRYEPEREFAPTAEQLAEYGGTYRSDEAEATYALAIERGALVVHDRYGTPIRLAPLYRDAFGSGGTVFRFVRDGSGRVVAVSTAGSRVWDLRFTRQP